MAQQPDEPGARPAGDMRETSVARVMTSTSIDKHPTAFSHTGLPILQVALDVAQMNTHLEPMLQPLAHNGSIPRVTYARLLAYKQGNRGLIEYAVAGTARGEGGVVLGKLYPEVSQTARVYTLMRALWDDVFRDSADFGIPQPLGYVPELSMLVYVPAVGPFLDEVLLGHDALRYMHLAAAWLGALHRARLPLERRFQMAGELVNLKAWAALIGHRYPADAETAAGIAQHLQDCAAALDLATDVPIHKDFHYGHMIADHGLRIIDFDEMRLGDPNFDLAHFCANLHLLAYRKTGVSTAFSPHQSVFLKAYARHTSWTPNRCFVFFYAYTCLKIAKQLCTGRGLRPRPEGDDCQRQMRLMLAQGQEALSHDPPHELSGKFATLTMTSLSPPPLNRPPEG
jgi:hypothetical protein